MGIAGSGIAGLLVQLLTAPLALVASAATLGVSGACLSLIQQPEPPPKVRPQGRDIAGEIGEGLRIVLGHPLLRPIVVSAGVHNFFSSAISALFVLYVTRGLGISPITLGIIFAFTGPGSLLAAFLAPIASRRLGLGPAIVGALLVSGLAMLLIPVSGWLPALAAPLLALAQFIAGGADGIYSVNAGSLRQAITPNELQGRVGATRSFMTLGSTPLGALLGGGLGQMIGLQAAVALAAVGVLTAFLLVLFSPVRALHEQPPPFEAD